MSGMTFWVHKLAWVARRYCCRFEISGSYTNCSFMSTKAVSNTQQDAQSKGNSTIVTPPIAVDTQVRVALSDLTRPDISQCSNRGETAVLREGQRNRVECRGKRPHSVLLDGRDLVTRVLATAPRSSSENVGNYLVCGLADGNSTADIS